MTYDEYKNIAKEDLIDMTYDEYLEEITAEEYLEWLEDE